MATTRIRTLNFLPSVFQTPTNSQFLNATLDQIVDQPNTMRIEGFIGSKFGYGINAKDKYVVEPNKTRTDYQLDPGVVFTKKDSEVAQDFISYPGILDSIGIEGGLTNNNNRLFNSQFYSWDSFTNLDKIINFNQYYWIPDGPQAVQISTDIVYSSADYVVDDTTSGYNISDLGNPNFSTNPTLTLIRGGTYNFTVDQPTSFWIQGAPGVTGYDPLQPNIQTREILGVVNNGINEGVVTFNVPFKNAQEEYNLPGNNLVDLVSTIPFDDLDGALVSSLTNGVDGITSLEGLTVLFYNTGSTNNQGFISSYYDETLFDENGGTSYAYPGTSGDFINYEGGYYTEINSTVYRIVYIGDPNNPIIRLVDDYTIPTNEKITVRYGNQYVNRAFYKNSLGVINIIPYLSSLLDVLYYQDGTYGNKVGIIKLIDSNSTNNINITQDILGKKNYTAPNGVVFTNGLKVIFSGNILPESYENTEYYVEGVGTAIELLPVTDFVVPGNYSQGIYLPYDMTPYDIGNYDINLYLPIEPDYITIARNSIDKNSWSRSNRWFHIDVIKATAEYTEQPNLLTLYATKDNKAKRPIIEFYPNLKLFNSGSVGKQPVDFIDFRTSDAFSNVAGQQNYYPDVETYTAYTAEIIGVVSGTSTDIIIPANDVTGTFKVGQFVSDSTNLLPSNTTVTNVVTTSSTITLTVSWTNTITFVTTLNSSIVGSSSQLNEYALFDGARIIFANDSNENVKNKIYVARFSEVIDDASTVITLTQADDGNVLYNDQALIFRGYYYQNTSYWYNGTSWVEGQNKETINQPPLFDIFDINGISFGNLDVYQGSSFKGNKLFAYGIGSGPNDPILGFPLRYSSVSNLGDISFDVSLNSDTFNYVLGSNPINEKVNNGYIHQYIDRINYTNKLGWETAVGESVQYQIFSFDYIASSPKYTFLLDVSPVSSSPWPIIKVFNNNVIQSKDTFTYTYTANSTTVSFVPENPEVNTVVQIAILSDQVSRSAYYEIPINLSNNPFNQDITEVNVGDIRGHYQTIFYNNPDTTGEVFGENNYRDLSNLVSYGTKIIQNSASLVLPGTFFRKQNYNLFNALLFNSKEYINFKTLLVNTVENTLYESRALPAQMLDDAIDQITANKLETESFFWSDMLPSKSAFITNQYSFANSLDTSIYPLSRIYDFSKASYYGVLVYLTRIVDGTPIVTQLIRNVDYTVSTDSPSLTITLDLLPNDQVIIKEYNQTYGSYVPNTPTKLGLYPASIPTVILDSNYTQPTYFIVGHDGSYNKLYGEYIDGALTDIRDQVLLEYEKRVYNNLKIDGAILPVTEYEILPGFFRNTDYSYDEFLSIYSEAFLNWVGQNRIDYQKQLYNVGNEYTWNYNQSGNKINNEQILQGYWRGIYQYFFDTTQPDQYPWEMIGYKNKPDWWETRYGPAPYTSDNLVLWNDLAQGIDWNNGDPVVLEWAIRPELLEVLPIDSAGNMLSPFEAIVQNYIQRSFNRDWKVGDVGPAEFSYRRSSTWPFDLMRIMALTKPAKFFNLAVDVDNYKYSPEFNQYLYNNRKHLVIDEIEIYGSGIPKTSYINWIVDYEKQVGIDATTNISELLYNLDVRLVYRMAGFSDKTLLKFYVEKGTPNSRNASLLIPDESYQVLLYDNQPFSKIVYSGVVVQITSRGYKIYGNSQTNAYFKTLVPKLNSNVEVIQIENLSVRVAKDYYDDVVLVPYGTEFYSTQEVSQFLKSYGSYLATQGVLFDQIESGLTLNWNQMIAEFLYWAQSGWEVGSLVNINPAAKLLSIDKDSHIVQPLTIQKTNFILNQNLYPVQSAEMAIERNGTFFAVSPLNQGDTIAYGQFNISNYEHGIVFNNTTLFNDVIYNLTSGLRQNRITVRGSKSAEWNGTVDIQGFVLNQDNITEWKSEYKYTKGQIVLYKNKYWVATQIIQPNSIFQENYWKETDYNEIQKGLLPNSSTRSYESTLYYDTNKGNLEQDADLLGFSLIGYRPRDYLALADLTDITQVNVYKNLIKEKGTRVSADAFKGAKLPQGGIDYEIYENWAIQNGEYGGVLNNNFIDIRLNQAVLTGNPSIVGLTNGVYTSGVQQEVPIYSIYNYNSPILDPNILSTIPKDTPAKLLPDAGYVNYNDIKATSFYFSGLSEIETPINNLYVGDYIWLADYLGTWQVYTPISGGTIVGAANNFNGVVTIIFENPHNLTKYEPFAIVSFNENIDGFYIVLSVLDQRTITISLNLPNNIENITGAGVVLKFQNQRVATSNDINTLPLLNFEFVKNKVWVDQNQNGEWSVYEKSLNYNYDLNLYKENSSNFGSAVAYKNGLGYLISDSNLGEVYRYTYEQSSQSFTIKQTLTESASFGTTIVHNKNIFVISQPTTTPKVYVYEFLETQTENKLTLLQEPIVAPVGALEWGTGLAISGDTNWLFISCYTKNQVYVYKKSTVTQKFEYANVITLPIFESGDNFGYKISTDYYGTTIAISAPNKNYNTTIINWGYAYLFDRLNQTIEVQTPSTPQTPQYFNLNYVPNSQSIPVISTTNVDNILTSSSNIILNLNYGQQFIVPEDVFGGLESETIYFINPITNTEFQLFKNKVVITSLLSLSNMLVVDNASGVNVNDPILITGNVGSSNLVDNQLYYIRSKTTVTVNNFTYDAITLKNNLGVQITIADSDINISGTVLKNILELTNEPSISMRGYVTTSLITVSVNGTEISDAYFALVNNRLYFTNTLNAGDIIQINYNYFTNTQTLSSIVAPETGVQYGLGLGVNKNGNEVLVGAPYQVTGEQGEGIVYRFTNSGSRYGTITGTTECYVFAETTIFVNGYAVTIPAGTAETTAAAINSANITNVYAVANNNILTIDLIDKNLAQINNKLSLSVLSSDILTQLGISLFTLTQLITDPHVQGKTQNGYTISGRIEFGYSIKFNEFESVVISSPAADRYMGTTFDQTDDANYDNDTIFDNNATQWLDIFRNAGAVYMYDYIPTYQENINNVGQFVYAQSVNSLDIEYGIEPYYGQSLDFNDQTVIIGSPNFRPNFVNGQVVVYSSASSNQDWSVLRYSSDVVDINKIENVQLYSAYTNSTLDNLDYFDPLQGKLLGVIQQNIDIISSVDPASYNSDDASQKGGLVWGPLQIGELWFDTSKTRFVNYHQNDDVVYNSQYWGQIFKGSDPAVYSWISSNVAPDEYTGPGTPYSLTDYVVEYVLDSSNNLVSVYYFWARNTNIIFTKKDKTLSDSICQEYILNPQASGVSYFTPLARNVFGLYNSTQYFNSTDTVLHLGFATGNNENPVHSSFTLIRKNFADDFLPGLPEAKQNQEPVSLYNRLLDSLSGLDKTGGVVPDPYLPKPVQYGIYARPRQSFFVNRLLALQNYLEFVNSILKQSPIVEINKNLGILLSEGEINPSTDSTYNTDITSLYYSVNPWQGITELFYDVKDYWNFVNWWAEGYNDQTKSAVMVQQYYDLATLTPYQGMIVTVAKNGDGKKETYRYTNGDWVRIGLENGTIQFSDRLWDYSKYNIGFGDNFFDTSPFDAYPAEETRNIVRAINEELLINELLLPRNQALIILFEYITSETIESQNYLPWLNKTSFIDVAHTIRELLPLEVFKSDNQDFLSGYLNEVKPYHVVIKEFLFKYTGGENYLGNVTDFDLPAKYNSTIDQYITPQLVYSNPSGYNEFLPNNNIWLSNDYVNWYNNYGLSLGYQTIDPNTGLVNIVGLSNYLMTTLSSYVTLNSENIYLDNAYGFPINGVIKIGEEYIGYSVVDETTNMITGLTRGVNGSPISFHLPGEQIFMDLPPVIVQNKGRGYVDAPKVTAYIDPLKYPLPRREAVLTPIMSFDTILRIDVVDPGEGYAVTPQIVIEPSIVITFGSSNVDLVDSSIYITEPLLNTGDLIKYTISGNTTAIGGLLVNQYYYVAVNFISSTYKVTLYTNIADAYAQTNKVQFYSIGTGDSHKLEMGARATCITNSMPVRENILSLKYDRTSYNSDVKDWAPGNFYGSFYAGSLINSDSKASSSVTLENVYPSIATIMASSQGATFEIQDVSNIQQINWGSRPKDVVRTFATGNIIRLTQAAGAAPAIGTITPVTGLYVDMPVKFIGVAGSSNIQIFEIYYIKEIVNDTDITISQTVGGPEVTLVSFIFASSAFQMYPGEVTNTALLEIQYPGLLTVTETAEINNAITVPLNPSGLGGTTDMFVNLPIFFTGNVFGGLIENEFYYVNTIIDKQHFTISKSNQPITVTITETSGVTNYLTCEDTSVFNVNDQVIFNEMYINGVQVSNFGNIISGASYYIYDIIDNNQFRISEQNNGAIFTLSTVAPSATTYCSATNQKNTVALSNATGSVTLNLGIPVSPGQIDGQRFTVYPTSEQYPGSPGDATLISKLERPVVSAVSETVVGEGGWLSIKTSVTDLAFGLSNMYVNMPIQLETSFGGLSASTTYYITELDYISGTATNTSSSGNTILVGSTDGFYVGMPLEFSGVTFGTIIENVIYYVKTIVSSTRFTISSTLDIGGIPGDTLTLPTDNGTMTFVGAPYIKVSNTLGGTPLALSNAYSYNPSVTLYNEPTSDAIFDVSYILGGYRVIITDPGAGYAIDNELKILGNLLGGTTPRNDLTLIVNSISSTGQILNVICQGTPAGGNTSYYFKVVGANLVEVYSDPLYRQPVSGLNFPYAGTTERSTTVTATNGTTDRITVADASIFQLYNPVVFTGNVFGNINLGQTYYIINIIGNDIQVSLDLTSLTPIPLSSETGEFTVAKTGDFAFLPEPFYFTPSLVKYNNRVYQCVISNNDEEFIIGKWELLQSDSRLLNELDRIIGYYQPTVNMPGVDISQLVDGTIYPNNTYLDNAFAPSEEIGLDTILKDQDFYPSDVDLTSVLYNGNIYISSANTPNSSVIVNSVDTIDGLRWNINQLTSSPINLTDLIYADGIYVLTSQSSSSPIYISNNGIVWTSTGLFTPYDIDPYDTVPYDTTAIVVESGLLNSVSYNNGKFVAVGENIVTSDNNYIWEETFGFGNNLDNEFYGVSGISSTNFNGFVAVGKAQYTENFVTVDRGVLTTSTNGQVWTSLKKLTNKFLSSVTTDGNFIVAVGENGVKYGSYNGSLWQGISEATIVRTDSVTNQVFVDNTYGFVVGDRVRLEGYEIDGLTNGTDYWIKNITSTTTVILSLDSGLVSTVTLTEDTTPTDTLCLLVKYPSRPTLNDVIFANSTFIAVGNSGEVQTSIDGISWTVQSSGTVSNIKGITYNSDNNAFVAVGDDNLILQSTDNGLTWESVDLFVVDQPIYNIQGDEFTAGYGPQELVPGVIQDNLSLIVTTRPGTVWDATIYQHVGYNVASGVITPTLSQTTFDFAELVENVVQIAVFDIDSATGLGRRLYETYDYTINWFNKQVILNAPLSGDNRLQIDAYEVGNGSQLVKSTNNNNPMFISNDTEFTEIPLNCKYEGPNYLGSGVYRPLGTQNTTNVIETTAVYNSLLCQDVNVFVINYPVIFTGTSFGGIIAGQTYYVKTINYDTKKITLSSSLINGVAGPEFALTTDVGLMIGTVNVGSGLVWTEPAVYKNGTKLVFGTIEEVFATQASGNIISCSNTGNFGIYDPVRFSNTIYGGLSYGVTYYINTIISQTEFTITDLPGNPDVTITNGSGSAFLITNDYSIEIAPDGTNSQLVFPEQLTVGSDYVAYNILGDTGLTQYGYTIPETQLITGDGVTRTFSLTNYVAGDNPNNAIVEIDGVRLSNTDYNISFANQEIVFNPLQPAPSIGSIISVTSYHFTERQYLNTNYNLTGKTVGKITALSNNIAPPIATENVYSYSGNDIVCIDTTGFIAGQTVQFYGTAFGNIQTNGVVYYVLAVTSGTTFTISATPGGPVFNPGTGTGVMLAVVGGQPAVRITTANQHNLVDNDFIRIDGVVGSTQLNNNTYYAKKINDYQIDIYQTPYSPLINATNTPITSISSYIGGGYIWKNNIFNPIITTATNTTTGTNIITVVSTEGLVRGTPVLFSGTTFGNIVAGTTYYVKEINLVLPNSFTISETHGGPEFALSTASGSMGVTQWEQTDVDRLYVTVNGYRVPSTSLVLNTNNDLSILVEINPSDEVTITSMMPSATPNELVYLQNTNKSGESVVYRTNDNSKTWLVQPLSYTDTTIYVNDITKLVNIYETTSVVTSPISSYVVGLPVDKRIITQIIVYNSTTNITLSANSYSLVIQDTAPELKITGQVNVGDNLQITVVLGNLVYISGEQIRYTEIDLENNTISGLVRGSNGTARLDYIPAYSIIYGILSTNQLPNPDYYLTWNSDTYNPVEGDPLQISTTYAAGFLNTDPN